MRHLRCNRGKCASPDFSDNGNQEIQVELAFLKEEKEINLAI
jgi:hypothetical protein